MFQKQFDDLNRRVAKLYQQEQFEQAIPIAEQARSLAEQHWGTQHSNYATAVCNLAELYHELGQYAEAEPLYLKTIEVRRAALGELDPYLAYTLNCLAELYLRTGRYTESETQQLEALEIRRTALGEEHPEFAESVNNLAALYRAMGRLDESESLYRQAIEIRRAALGDSHPDLATSLNNLALLYDSLGRYGEAEPLYLQAVEIWRKTLGEEHSHYAAGLNNLAMLYDSMGRYADAAPLYQQAMEIWRKVFGEQHPNYGTCLNNLAELYRAVGQYELAEPLYLREVEICRATQGDNTPSFAVSLNNLAALYRAMGKYQQAEPVYLQALEIRRTTLGDDHPGFAESLSNVGVFFESLGRYDEAERLQEQAREIRQARLGETHPSYATSLNNLAALYRATGRNSQAESYYERSLGIRLATLGESHPNVAQSLNNLAVLYVATGREDRGLELMQQAAAVHRELIGQIFSISSESRRMAFLQRIEVQYHALLTLVWRYRSDSPTAVAAALDFVLGRKAIGAEALAVQRDAVLAGRYPQHKPALDKLNALRGQIANKTLAGPGKEGLDAHQQSLHEWSRQKERIETDLVRQIPEMKFEQTLRSADCRAVEMRLPPETVLIEFVRFNAFDFRAVAERLDDTHWRPPRQWQPARYVAFVLRIAESNCEEQKAEDGAEPLCEMIDLGEADRIDQLIAAFQSRIVGGQRGLTFGEPRAADSTEDTAGQSLRAALFDPVARRLAGCRRLLLAPDGSLSVLPFEVLPTIEGRRLIDDYQISYVATGRDVMRFGRVPSGLPGEPIIVADPDYDLSTDGTDETAGAAGSVEAEGRVRSTGRRSPELQRDGTLSFKRLPATAIEGEQIAEKLGTSALWVRDAALDATLKTVRSPRILHLATHGFFLEDRPIDRNAESEPGLRSVRQSQGDRSSVAGMENPLLRSGLVLAGVNTWFNNRPVPAEAEDGVLTAEDVTGMDLLDTELVVLSACETGVGEVRTGEGVFGLRRAFVLAGAQTLLMSLWRVPDDQTQALMDEFYRLLQSGTPRAESLRKAQLSIKERHPEPYYWGGFICQGDPGRVAMT